MSIESIDWSDESTMESQRENRAVRRAALWCGLVGLVLSLILFPAHAGHTTSQYALSSTTHVGILGDSIYASSEIQDPVSHFDARLAEALRVPPGQVINYAISGQSLTGPHPNLTDTAPGNLSALSNGDIVVLDIGMNDACNGAFNLATFSTALTSIVAQAQAMGLRVLIGQITPVVPALSQCEPARQQINAWEGSAFPHATVIRYPDRLHSFDGQTWIQPRYAMEDGKHPDEGATAIMADMTASTILAPAVTYLHR